MATKLLKPISRETLAVSDMKGNIQVMTMVPGDMLEFRGKGKRFRYEVPIAAVYYLAIIHTHQQIYKEKLIEYDRCKKAGIKKRKPHPLPRVFSPKLYEALRIN